MEITVPISMVLFMILTKISQTLQAEIQTGDFERRDNNVNHDRRTKQGGSIVMNFSDGNERFEDTCR
jgi:anti-sigma regulatory factor (Ser/Thr protein kinase)